MSLATRCPKEALHLARGLAYLGQRLLSNPAVYNMDYQEIRSVLFEHFKELREQIKAKINRLGPFSKTDKLSFEKSYAEANGAFEAETYSLIATDKRLTEIAITAPVIEGSCRKAPALGQLLDAKMIVAHIFSFDGIQASVWGEVQTEKV